MMHEILEIPQVLVDLPGCVIAGDYFTPGQNCGHRLWYWLASRPVGNRSSLRQQLLPRRPVVFTNGVFDLFHAGHLALFQQIRERYPECHLIVAVNTHRSAQHHYVDTDKHEAEQRPVLGEVQRLLLVGACRFVDVALLMDDPTPHALLQALQPQVLVKADHYSHEQVVGHEIVAGYGGLVDRIPTWGQPLCSSTEIIQKIRSWPRAPGELL